MIPTGKAEIRREMRAKRRALDPAAQRRAATGLARNLAGMHLFGPGRRVAFYFSSDGEIDPAFAMRAAAKAGTVCLVPLVPGRGRRRLRFARVDGPWPLKCNRFGIPEPAAPPTETLSALELDCICLPLVAFDDNGNRVGMGGGYYDATLASHGPRRRFRRPVVVGLAHECQKLGRIDAEPWDIPLDRIVTDRGVYQLKRNRTS